jgi:hypothetical protein
MILGETLKNPDKYDELGISTGLIFNKSRVVLKEMAKFLAQKESDSRSLSGTFGLKDSDRSGCFPNSNLKSWKGLKALIENPDKGFVSEEIFKIIAAKDLRDIKPEQVEAYKQAVRMSKCFNSLRGSLKTYGEISKSRMLNKYSWLLEEKKAQPLGPASSATPVTQDDSDIHSSLAGKVENEPDYTDIPNPQSGRQDRMI